MSTEWFSSLVLIQAYRDILVDTKSVGREFCAKKNKNFFFLIETTS